MMRVVLLLCGAWWLVLALHSTTTLEQRVYLPKCSSSWYLSNQGSEGESDFVVMKCENFEPEPDTPDQE